MTELLAGLGPVAGIACTAKGLVVSTRGADLWRVGTDGVHRLIAAVPRLLTENLGTDIVASREDGELAVRLIGRREILVLHHGEKDTDDYSSSHVIDPKCSGTPMAFDWDGVDLVVAMDSGAIHRITMDSEATQLASVDGVPVAVARSKDTLLVLCAPGPSTVGENRRFSLWRIPHDDAASSDLLAGQNLSGLNGLVCMGDEIYVSDFDGGRILRMLSNGMGNFVTIADGLVTPGQIAADSHETLYVAEFSAGAVRRILS
ncbi:hypothetical protein ABT124_50395 [Streptomyces sp. NPDC001982]|uniref:hypothetical protein n=1 Tax=Streptomyces sp. NPDC001982 TaxID=3154405 RepID=UPI00332A9DF4